MERSERFVEQYKKDRATGLPPCPPVKKEEVMDFDGPAVVDVNAGARRDWVQQKYHAKIPVQKGYNRKYAAGWDRIFGS